VISGWSHRGGTALSGGRDLECRTRHLGRVASASSRQRASLDASHGHRCRGLTVSAKFACLGRGVRPYKGRSPRTAPEFARRPALLAPIEMHVLVTGRRRLHRVALHRSPACGRPRRAGARLARSAGSQRLTDPRQLPKLALTKAEAAEALSMSVESLERYVLPELRVVRRGRLVSDRGRRGPALARGERGEDRRLEQPNCCDRGAPRLKKVL
jgi:hypothetical protein